MAENISLSAFGNPIGLLPREAFNTAVNAAKSYARDNAEDLYKQAQSTASKSAQLSQQYATNVLQRGIKATSTLTKQVAPILRSPIVKDPAKFFATATNYAKSQAQEFGAEMGAAAAAGAREDTMEAVKRWAPWAIGGVAVAGLGIWLLRR